MALGEDDLTGFFFQKYWSVIFNDICNVVQSFFTRGGMLKGNNHTIISLIPKVKQVKSMRDLRPIGLCNVTYKIISKLRLKPFMNFLIDHE